MAYVARVFDVGKGDCFSGIRFVIEVPPDEFSQQWRSKNGLGVIALARRNRSQLISIGPGRITSLFYAIKGLVPDDDLASRMSGRDQAIYDRIHDFMMGRKQFAAGSRNLDPDFVIGRDQRRPAFSHG